MQLIINGEKKEFQDNITLLEVLERLQIKDRIMAAAVNMEIVKKEKWKDTILKENDKIELLDFVGGG